MTEPRIRLQLHKAKSPAGFDLFWWEIRAMDGRALIESPMYPTPELAEKAIKGVEIKFDPLRVVWADTKRDKT